MTIGVTGASGFIGSNLCESLNKHYSVVKIDLKDKILDDYDFSGINVIVHLAGIAHKIKNSDNDIYFKVNRDLAYQTALKAKTEGVQHFIFMSTSKVYGDFSAVHKAFYETSECNPQDAYAMSKYEAEKLIADLSDDFFNVAILRPPLVYGPGVKANMLNLIKLVVKIPVIPLRGVGNKRSIVYVGNLIAVVGTIIEKKLTGVFIPADKQPLSTSEIVQFIIAAVPKKRKLIGFPSFVNSMFRTLFPYYYSRVLGSFVLNNSLTQKMLQEQMPYSSEYGIKATVDWYLQHK